MKDNTFIYLGFIGFILFLISKNQKINESIVYEDKKTGNFYDSTGKKVDIDEIDVRPFTSKEQEGKYSKYDGNAK